MRRLLSILGMAGWMLTSASPAAATGHLRIYYAGPEGAVRTALDLAAEYDVVSDPGQADVLVFNGVFPASVPITDRVAQGAGLVLILGPDVTAEDLRPLLGPEVGLEPREEALSLDVAEGAADPILEQVVWTSAPQVRARSVLTGASLTPLIVGFEDGGLVLGSGTLGRGRYFVFTPYLDGANSQFQEWAYFNYVIYQLTSSAGGRTPATFADYPGSPVPHARERTVLFLALAGMMALSLLAFVLVRRYSRAHPEALDDLLTNRKGFATREAGTDWEEIGFHRPLGGFMLALMLGLVMFVPLIIYQNLILPVYILPSAQALGIWGRVTQFFNVIWYLFDMGTSAAFIKFFAQHRVHEPRQAIQYAQVFVWWQALSGAFQVAMVTAVAGTVLPRTTYALYAWSIIVHTLIQIPGFYQVMRHALMSWQRFDYAQIIELGLYLLFPMVTQPIIVTVMVAWGRNHPVFGMSMGGLLGLGLAAYASELLAFLLGLWLYRRLGYGLRVIFLAHFDWQTVKTAFRFGVFEMAGSLAWTIGQAVEILITQARLVNYAEVWGNWGLAQNFVFGYQALATLYNSLMPSISEAISHGRRLLSQYYSAVAYKWGGMLSAFIGAVLLAVADRFILGASGPEFVRAATYAIPLILWGAIQYPSWVGDNVQRAANRPGLMFLMVGMEQTIRIVLAWLLLARFQIYALIIAYFVGLFTKDVVAYFVNHKLCFPQRFYFWQSLGAPILAGATHYVLLRWVTGLIWRGDQITSVLIFLVGILFSYPFFAFFYGLFGGWDDPTLAELRRAVDLSSFMRPLSWLFWAGSALGARLSPLHGRFPIDIRPAALAEAESLTAERVRL